MSTFTKLLSYADVPGIYIHCNAECEAADTCLRALAAQLAPQKKKTYNCYNHAHLTVRNQNCPYYQNMEPVEFGIGLKRYLDLVPYGKLRAFEASIAAFVGSTRQYYRVRKGELALSPEQQERMNVIAARHGLPTPVTYDSTEMRIKWDD